MKPAEIIAERGHRPWPLPRKPWIMRQSWHDLLFAHWRVDPAVVQRVLPRQLELDTLDGAAYLGVIPFWMSHVRMRGSPGVPTATRFPELNVRTYVRGPKRVRSGQATKPGVYFFSLDAGSLLAVLGARVGYFLRYQWATMKVKENGGEIHYSSRRIHPPRAGLVCTYAATGEAREKTVAEHFVTERYCLYSLAPGGLVLRGNIHHVPWPLQPARTKFEQNSMASVHGIELEQPNQPDLLSYAKEMDVLIWPPERA